ncbi:ATP-binding protein, partial [Streptomyces hydrogenans]|uniref:ATP-binding protein n=1 Tax=Streptomyces hydrogenans TaxID=1873719 RepID=UPI00345D2B21
AERGAVLGRGWSTRGPGRGLGLALVQQAVTRAAGTLTLAETPEGGARFTVRVPLPRRAGATDGGREPERTGGAA